MVDLVSFCFHVSPFCASTRVLSPPVSLLYFFPFVPLCVQVTCINVIDANAGRGLFAKKKEETAAGWAIKRESNAWHARATDAEGRLVCCLTRKKSVSPDERWGLLVDTSRREILHRSRLSTAAGQFVGTVQTREEGDSLEVFKGLQRGLDSHLTPVLRVKIGEKRLFAANNTEM